MAGRPLATYLNDHLAGATAAVELLTHLEQAHAGTAAARYAAGLREDIAADRAELQGLMARLHVPVSVPRKAAGWLGGKVAEWKLRLDDPSGGVFHLFESMEALSLGIEGKRLLWRALAAVAQEASDLGGTDYARLERRAEEQRQRAEALRVEAARRCLGTTA